MPPITIERTVYNFKNLEFGKPHVKDYKKFYESCTKPVSFSDKIIKKIVIEKPKLKPKILLAEKIEIPDTLSFSITKEDVIQIHDQIIDIARDPELVMELLKDLDDELGKELEKNGIVIENSKVQHELIAGKGWYILFPVKDANPSKNYVPAKHNRTLNDLLLKREQLNGINIEYGDALKFLDIIPRKLANQFAAKNTFGENQQINGILFHGKYSHRLMLEVLRQAIAKGKLNLKLQSGQELSFKQLLELMVMVQIKKDQSSHSLWDNTIDTTADSLETSSPEKVFDSDTFNFSCCSPFVFNSLLKCFGDSKLRNLPYYLRENDRKELYKFEFAIKSFYEQRDQYNLEKKYPIKTPDFALQLHCLNFLLTANHEFTSIPNANFFTLTAQQASTNKNYQKITEGVVIRKNPTQKEPPYTSLADFQSKAMNTYKRSY